MPRNSPRISLKVLRNLIINLPPERLAELPVDSLPDNIPVGLVDQAHPGKRAILEDKLLEHQAYILSVREIIRRELGVHGINAYDLAQQDFSTTHLEKFSSRFKEYQAYKGYFDFQSQDDGAQTLLGMLDKEQPEAEDMQHDYLELLRAEKCLRNAALPEHVQDRVERARVVLNRLIQLHESHLSQYFSERLALAVIEMRRFREEMEVTQSQRGQVLSRIELREQTGDEDSKLLSDNLYRSPSSEIGGVDAKLLSEQLFSLELPYGEAELTRWMDYMVDYFLHFKEGIEADPLFTKANKYLQALMSLSFQMSQATTRKIREDQFADERSAELAQYQQRSREYMEHYFERRAGDLYEQSRSTLFDH